MMYGETTLVAPARRSLPSFSLRVAMATIDAAAFRVLADKVIKTLSMSLPTATITALALEISAKNEGFVQGGVSLHVE